MTFVICRRIGEARFGLETRKEIRRLEGWLLNFKRPSTVVHK
jgi:hypothetical protein